MTKLEIFNAEQVNDGRVYLYPEGMFYKAYEKSAFLLCANVHQFKVSSNQLKSIDEPLVSVGFPFSSLEKFSAGLSCDSNRSDGVVVLSFADGRSDFDGFTEWKSQFKIGKRAGKSSQGFDAFPIWFKRGTQVGNSIGRGFFAFVTRFVFKSTQDSDIFCVSWSRIPWRISEAVP